MSVQIRAPKRPIERVRNRINQTVSDSQANAVLFTADDPMTLVRMLVELTVHCGVVATADAHLIIAKAPNGQGVVTPTISQALDVNAPEELLAERSVAHATLSNIDQGPYWKWEVDSKAMRKMKTGDTILLSTLADVASSFLITGHITMWFKK